MSNNEERVIPDHWEDITPDDSFGPVYLDPIQLTEGIEFEPRPDPDVMAAEQVANKESAILKLKKLGLTEDEARAVIGGI